jgi:hypothetical protein
VPVVISPRRLTTTVAIINSAEIVDARPPTKNYLNGSNLALGKKSWVSDYFIPSDVRKIGSIENYFPHL